MLKALVLPGWPPRFLFSGWADSVRAYVFAVMMKAPFMVVRYVDRTNDLY